MGEQRAVWRFGAEDVTRAYVNDWYEACRGRRAARGWREKALKRVRREVWLAG